MAERVRILVLQGPKEPTGCAWEKCFPGCDMVYAPSLAEGLALLQADDFAGVYVNTSDWLLRDRIHSLLQADEILSVLGEGVAVVNTDQRILWANAAFEKWAPGGVGGRGFFEALGSAVVLGPDFCPFHTALAGKKVATRLHLPDNQHLELKITPVLDLTGRVTQLITLCRDITAEVGQQQKLNALHLAVRELAALTPEQLAEMDIEERVELLKLNIRRLTHDLLHYDVIEIRLLDASSGRLEPLLAEGMTPEAAQRVLYARPEGNGVTGHVASTGKSYLCPDAARDPLYLEGAKGARSSMTVALTLGDKVIGTLNVESPQLQGFGEEDLQFAEIFSREIASAIHTLELLSAEKRTTGTRFLEAVGREVALPVDEILNSATSLLDRWIGLEPEMADKLKQILASARSIKQCIQKVGDNLAPPAKASTGTGPKERPRLKGMRILVVDNDERVRRSAHGLLGRVGCTVETARNGKEALTMARQSPYDAMLADIRLPDLTGADIYRGLREAQPLSRVILMSAYGYDPSHSIVKARQDGLRLVLYKPFRVDQLLDALESSEPSAVAAAASPPQPVQA